MKRIFLLFTFCYCLINSATAQKIERIDNVAQLDKMKDDYEGFLRVHRRSDGVVVKVDELTKILEDLKGRKVALVFARTLDDQEPDKKRRPTLLLKVFNLKYNPAVDKLADKYIYYHIGADGICPQPDHCDFN